MFSAGNITEKLRVAGFDCRGETVVDLYAGGVTLQFYNDLFKHHQSLGGIQEQKIIPSC